MARWSQSRLTRRSFLGAGLTMGAAAGLAACAPAAAPSPTPAGQATTTSSGQSTTQAATPAPKVEVTSGDKTIRVLTSDFFYDAMVLPATAIFNDQQQGQAFVKVEKAPEGWVTKALSMVREKNVLWSSYAVDSFFNLYQRIQTGMAAPLDDYFKASKVPWAKNFGDEYVSRNVYESGVFDGKFYIMPTKLNTTIVPYNKTMVNEVGYEKPPETWDEFRVMLHKIKDRFGAEDVIPTSINLDLWRSVGGIFCTLSEKPYTDEGMVDLDSDEWFEAMDLMKSFYTDGLAEPKLLGSPDEQVTWQKGKIAVIFNYPSWLHLAQNAWGRQTYDAVNMPKPQATGKPRSWMHVDGTYLIQNSPNPQETVDWMLTILGPEGEAADTFARGTVTRSGSPMYKKHIESPIVKDNPDYPWLYGTYETMANSVQAPLSPLHFLVDAKGKKYLPPFFRGEMDAKTAVAKIKEEVEAEKDKMLSGAG